jgi:xylulokinase
MTPLVGVDIGTSATKVLAINRHGRVVRKAECPYRTVQPRPGFSEQDPEDWVQAASQALSDIATSRPAGLAFTGQMHGLVLLDGHGRLLRPAILWNDNRAAAERRLVEERIGLRRLLELVGNRPMPGFTAPSLLWVREHETEIWRQIRQMMTPKDYVRWRLVGGDPLTDVSDASGTLLFDVRARKWSAELIDELELERDWLPDVVESPERVGSTLEGTPVAAGAGDQAAGALGAGLRPNGPIGVAVGTSGVITQLRTTPPGTDINGRLQEICGCAVDVWQTMGVTLSAGGSLAWWQRCSGSASMQTLLAEASAWPAGCDGLTFLPYLSGERAPHLDESVRGSFTGLSAHHDRGAMTRAVLEGIACSLADVLTLIRPDGPAGRARLSGGVAQSTLISEILASTLGLALEHTLVKDAAAYGAALLAGVAAGVFADMQEAAGLPQVSSVTEPDPSHTARYLELHEHYRSLYRAPTRTAPAECSPRLQAVVGAAGRGGEAL